MVLSWPSKQYVQNKNIDVLLCSFNKARGGGGGWGGGGGLKNNQLKVNIEYIYFFIKKYVNKILIITVRKLTYLKLY